MRWRWRFGQSLSQCDAEAFSPHPRVSPGMIEHEGRFQNADGFSIAYRAWLPDTKPRAIVLISHGLSEHSGRYRHVAEALVTERFVCYGIDHRGHGLSEGRRAYVPDGWQLVADLAQLHDIVSARHDGCAVLLCGHSMGALIGLGFALRYPGRLRGMALIGAPVHSEFDKPRWLIALCLWAARYLPTMRFSPPGSPTVLTHDAAMLQAWREDPLVNKGMWRIGTSAALIQLARDIRENASQLELPLLLLHGGDDRLAPASGSQFLAAQASSADSTLRIYPELRHELVNEVGRDEIIATIRDWLLALC